MFLKFKKDIKVKFYNIPITVCIYLNTGLTAKSVINRYKNQRSTTYTYQTMIGTHELNKKLKWKAKANLFRFQSYIKNIKYKKEDLIFVLLGKLYFLYDYIRHKELRYWLSMRKKLEGK